MTPTIVFIKESSHGVAGYAKIIDENFDKKYCPVKKGGKEVVLQERYKTAIQASNRTAELAAELKKEALASLEK